MPITMILSYVSVAIFIISVVVIYKKNIVLTKLKSVLLLFLPLYLYPIFGLAGYIFENDNIYEFYYRMNNFKSTSLYNKGLICYIVVFIMLIVMSIIIVKKYKVENNKDKKEK